MSEKLFKTKQKPPLITEVIKDQVFAWNKYVKSLLLVTSALVNVTN